MEDIKSRRISLPEALNASFLQAQHMKGFIGLATGITYPTCHRFFNHYREMISGYTRSA
jgi:hypothetical protein